MKRVRFTPIEHLEHHIFALNEDKRMIWRITDEYKKDIEDEIKEYEMAIKILKNEPHECEPIHCNEQAKEDLIPCSDKRCYRRHTQFCYESCEDRNQI